MAVTESSVRAEIDREVEKVLAETEASTLSLGNNLGRVLQETRGLIAELKSRVGGLSSHDGSSVSSVLESQVRTVSEFVQLLGTTIAAQSRLTERVLATSRTVAAAAEAVEAISRQSRMLSLNTMIEAERLGADGRPVMVIAREMRELSDSISDSNHEICRLVTELDPALADVEANLGKLRTQTTEFEQRFEHERERISTATAGLERIVHETLECGDRRLDSIATLTNSSLVDLQSQDIISQRLRRVMKLNVGELDGEPSRPLLPGVRQPESSTADQIARGEATSGYLSEQLSAASTTLGSGEMLMF